MTLTQFILVVVSLLIYYYYYYANTMLAHETEHYTPFPSNSFEVPKLSVPSLYDQDTNAIDDVFDTLNKNVLPDYKASFQKYPSYFKFTLDDFMQDLLLQRIREAFNQSTQLKGSKLAIVRNLYNIWWKDINNDRHFIFNVDIVNKTKFFARKLLVYVKMRDISRFVTDTSEYIPGIQKIVTINDVDLQYVGTDNELKYFTVASSDDVIGKEPFNQLYRIKNNLYLMDPFVTSGKDMVISDYDSEKFQQYLLTKQTEQEDKTKNGFCYNTSNPSASTKLECIDSGGVWDYPPQDDVECPFYGANQNYPNTFGKIVGDKCELPRNMQIIGNRNYSFDPSYNPLCYNCKTKKIGQGTLGYCCEDQKKKQSYPMLLSPDYAFVGDGQLRQKYAEELRQKDLSIG